MANPSITDVLSQLDAEHDSQYVYRGQVREYEPLLPSATRGFTRLIDGAGYYLDRKKMIADQTVRGLEREKFRRFLVSRLGSAMGELFAQQYGMGSSILDVTSSTRVAGFFSTRSWPNCIHQGASAGTGVIYRWRRADPTRTPEEFEGDATVGMLTRIGFDAAAVPTVVRIATTRSEQQLIAGQQDAWVTMPSTVFTVEEIRRFIEAKLSNAPPGYHPDWILDSFEKSRWAAQSGGLFRPEMRYPAYLGLAPDDSHLVLDDPQLGGTRLNKVAIIDLPDAVTDATQIGPPDVFRFVHSDIEVAGRPQDLWPSVESDQMFFYTASMAWTSSDYFEYARANTPWERVAGLLDRGYYPESETEDYERGQFDEWLHARKAAAPHLFDGTPPTGNDV